jgi:hypothetical protein
MHPSSGRGLLFWLIWIQAVVLGGLVLIAPFLDRGDEQPDGSARLVALFARDVALRRTALASAVGLAVCASVFFRATPVRQDVQPLAPPRPRQPWGAGA